MTDKFDPILISQIRKTMPSLIAEEIVNVQPMQDEHMDAVIKFAKSCEEREYQVGDRIHDFIQGWMRWDGHKFISEDLWWHLKIHGVKIDK